jgi:hypothetical protein
MKVFDAPEYESRRDMIRSLLRSMKTTGTMASFMNVIGSVFSADGSTADAATTGYAQEESDLIRAQVGGAGAEPLFAGGRRQRGGRQLREEQSSG